MIPKIGDERIFHGVKQELRHYVAEHLPVLDRVKITEHWYSRNSLTKKVTINIYTVSMEEWANDA